MSFIPTISSTGTSPMQAQDLLTLRAPAWTLNDFKALAVPQSATVIGIELLINMSGGNLTNGGEYFKVNNGTSDSSAKAATTSFAQHPTFSNMTIGGTSDLWGLSWTPTTANNITAKWDISFNSGGNTAYFDHVQIRISYKPGAGKITLTSGKVILGKGKSTIVS